MELTEGQITLNEIAKTQGTRLQDLPPWMSYAAEFSEKLDPKLEEEIKVYSEKKHEKTSAQNQEEACRQFEMSAEVAKQYQWLHPSEYINEGPKIGKIMHSSELINTLRNKCGIKCWYVEHPQPGKITLLLSDKFGMIRPWVGCWVQHGFMPEYSIMRFDRYGVPLDEKYRGWRTVLLQLILQKVLTEEKANRVFGIASGPASDRFLSILYGVRNTMEE